MLRLCQITKTYERKCFSQKRCTKFSQNVGIALNLRFLWSNIPVPGVPQPPQRQMLHLSQLIQLNGLKTHVNDVLSYYRYYYIVLTKFNLFFIQLFQMLRLCQISKTCARDTPSSRETNLRIYNVPVMTQVYLLDRFTY